MKTFDEQVEAKVRMDEAMDVVKSLIGIDDLDMAQIVIDGDTAYVTVT